MRISWLIVLLSLVSCAGPKAVPAAATPRASHRTPPSDGWSTQTWEERHDTMTWVVLPNLARLFQEFEGQSEPRLSCFTCHGRDAEQVAYAMPRGLPPLDPAHLPDRHSADAREAKLAAFMADEVVPRMANMTLDPNVTCFTCHPKEGDR